MKPWHHILIGFLACLILIGVGLLFFLPDDGTPIALVTLTPNLTPSPSQTPVIVTVHILGAVESPGVYTFPEGTRVMDAINAAGVRTDQVDLTRLNLAAVVEDGQRLYVPLIPTPTASGDKARSVELQVNTLININTATAQELEQLPEIGRSKAEAIVAYRDAHGPFLSLEDLDAVNGIGASIIAAIRDLVTLGP